MRPVLPCPGLPLMMCSSPTSANGTPLRCIVYRGGRYGSAKSSRSASTLISNHSSPCRKSGFFGFASPSDGSGILFSSVIFYLTFYKNLIAMTQIVRTVELLARLRRLSIRIQVNSFETPLPSPRLDSFLVRGAVLLLVGQYLLPLADVPSMLHLSSPLTLFFRHTPLIIDSTSFFLRLLDFGARSSRMS